MASSEKENKLKQILEKQKQKESFSSGGPVDLNQQEMLNEFYSLNARFDKIVTELSQVKGKIEMEEESRSSIGDRISDITSQIGELRSIVVSREKFFDKMESDFLKIKEDISSINPQEIQNQFEKLDGRFVKDEVKIDKNDNRLSNIEESLKSYHALMGKIKGFDNLFEMLQDLNKKISYIEQINNKSERLNAKMESIFSEINDKASSIGTHEDRLNSIEKNISQIGSRVDKATSDIKKSATKEDIKSLSQKFSVMKERLFQKEVVSFINHNIQPQQNISESEGKISESKENILDLKQNISKSNQDFSKSKQDISESQSSEDISRNSDISPENIIQQKDNIKASDFSKALHVIEEKKKEDKVHDRTVISDNARDINPRLINLLNYIKENISKGINQDELKSMIIEIGWPESDFNECMKYV